MDPKKFNDSQSYSLNEKSDVYSVGVLLWEISSGQPPFGNTEYVVSKGQREKIVPGTPEDYAKLYTGKYNYF